MAFKLMCLTLMLANAFAVSSAGVIGAVTYANVAKPSVETVSSTNQNVVHSYNGHTVAQHSKAIDTPYSSVHKEHTHISNNYAVPLKTISYASATPDHAVYTHSVPVSSKTHDYTTVAVPNTVVYNHHDHHEPATVYSTHGLYHHQQQHQHQHKENVAAHHAPGATVALYTHAQPVATKTVSYATPIVDFHHSHHAPAVVSTIAKTHHNHGHDESSYRHNAQLVNYHHHNDRYVPAVVSTATKTHSNDQDDSAYRHHPVAAINYHHHHEPEPAVLVNTAAASAAHSVKAPNHGQVHYSPADAVSHISFEGFGTQWASKW